MGRQLDIAKGLDLLIANREQQWKAADVAAAALPDAEAELAEVRRKVVVAKADVAK